MNEQSRFFQALLEEDHDFFYKIDWTQALVWLTTSVAATQYSKALGTTWVTHGEKIRCAAANDGRLAQILRKWLPPYTGEALLLYRGESFERANTGRYGLCWTTDLKAAETFGAGWHACAPKGGVVLESLVPKEAIITQQGTHSSYLGEAEYTVDTTGLGAVKVLKTFPALWSCR